MACKSLRITAHIACIFFKPLSFGHQVGDMVLQHIAKVLSKTVHKTDIVARYPNHACEQEQLLNSADTAMYDANNAGRNQVKSAEINFT